MSELRQLTRQDVLFVGGETARVYQHTAGLVLLDNRGRPDFNFKAFREHVIERVGQIPHFHWKLHEVPLGLDLPYWVDDDNFNYEHHIKHIAVPSPGDRVALGELVAHLYSKHLDRSRPLWEIWFIEGLADGKFAILQKLHHCMMDGEGASKLGEIMCDFEPDAPPHKIDRSISGAKAGDTPSPWQQSLNTTAHLAGMAFGVRREILDFVGPKIRRQLTFKKEPVVAAPVVPRACFNADISSHRGFVFGSLPLADIKAIKNYFEVSVNDVVIAIVGGSMRAYLLAQNKLPEQSLRIGMPVSLRSEGDDEFSNQVTNTNVTLATDLADPRQRLRVIHGETEQGKKKARGGAKGLMEVMQMMPPLLVSGLVLAATNYKVRVARHEQLVVLPVFAGMVGLGKVVELFSHLPKGLIKRFLPRLADQLHEDEARWALDQMRRTSFRVVLETAREMAMHDASAWLHEVDVPTSVVITERDRAVPPAHQLEMAELIAEAECFYHDDGHLACVTPDFGPVLAQACLAVAGRVT